MTVSLPSPADIRTIEDDIQLLQRFSQALVILRAENLQLLRAEPPYGHGVIRNDAARHFGRHFSTIQGLERQIDKHVANGDVDLAAFERRRLLVQRLADDIRLHQDDWEEDMVRMDRKRKDVA
jgi:hypothetical protein